MDGLSLEFYCNAFMIGNLEGIMLFFSVYVFGF